MNLRTCSFAATLLTTVFSLTLPSPASSVEAVESSTDQRTTTTTHNANWAPPHSPEIVKRVESPTPPASATPEQPIAKIYSYHQGNYPAATLYVRSIPVITFLSSPHSSTTTVSDYQFPTSEPIIVAASQVSGAIGTNQLPQDPAWQATQVANRLNQLQQDNVDAHTIGVRWDEASESFAITVGEQQLVAINEQTTLPDTTGNLAEDARQATNRLRRLLGNAPPIQEIPGLPKPQAQTASAPVQSQTKQTRGTASWYGPGFHGRTSASGERYNQNALTAAHRTLPFGTKVRVTNLNNGRSVIVRINDRGPFIRGRVIDVSAAAARAIGMVSSGVAPVSLEVLN